ncbi:hypothetical protein [Actinomadura sp. 6N118]|uniref:hypothetical protein n=1 Tax=Actinomadura sp. 6N118 TaxID=3375151 RepID=UPI0037BC5B86
MPTDDEQTTTAYACVPTVLSAFVEAGTDKGWRKASLELVADATRAEVEHKLAGGPQVDTHVAMTTALAATRPVFRQHMWQLGYLQSSADAVQQAAEERVYELALAGPEEATGGPPYSTLP